MNISISLIKSPTWHTGVFHLFVVRLIVAAEPSVHLKCGARLFAFTVSVNDRCESAVCYRTVPGFKSAHG